MIERIALLLTMSLAAVAIYYLLRAAHMRRMQPAISSPATPSLLYFRSDSCAVCPAQGRIIDQIAAQWAGRLHIERVDAEREPETAARYRVLTLPTTILIDPEGHVRQINYGLADERKLGRQLADVIGDHSSIHARPATTGMKSA